MRERGLNTYGSGYEQMGAVSGTIMNFSSIKRRAVGSTIMNFSSKNVELS
jgi:hypothetical protein